MQLEPIQKLTKDTKLAAKSLSSVQARFLVDQYYIIQEDRKRTGNQVRSMNDEPHETLEFFFNQNKALERQIKNALDAYSASQEIGQWMRSIKGIGPVIAAGLMAHIDMDKAPTVGHIWRFAGLDPTVKWEKGRKRPWNASLKTLCWKIGQSFVKVSGGDNPSPYGIWYREKKEYYIKKNEAGDYKERAAKILESKNIGKNTDAYKAYSNGKLPPAQIDQMAQRWATKLFLSHMHHHWHIFHFGEEPPKPYAIAHLDHAHMIEPPEFKNYYDERKAS